MHLEYALYSAKCAFVFVQANGKLFDNQAKRKNLNTTTQKLCYKMISIICFVHCLFVSTVVSLQCTSFDMQSEPQICKGAYCGKMAAEGKLCEILWFLLFQSIPSPNTRVWMKYLVINARQ